MCMAFAATALAPSVRPLAVAAETKAEMARYGAVFSRGQSPVDYLIDGTAPDKDDKAWEAAEKDAVEFVQQWTESCQLTNECTCAWGKK